MASKSTVLPLYNRNSNGFPVFQRRKTLKSIERYMVYLIFFIFMTLCYSAFFLLPDLRGRMNNVPEIFNPQIGGARPGIVLGHEHDEDPNEDFHLRDDRRKLNLQIRQDQALQEARNAIQKPPFVNDGDEVNNDFDQPKEQDEHDRLKQEVDQEKEKFLQEREEQERAKREEAKLAAKARLEQQGYISISDGEPADAQAKERRDKVREMMIHAWNGYETYAWGANELKPISHTGHSASIFGKTAMGATIVDGVDTLYIMGLTEQYQKAHDWIAHDFNFNPALECIPFRSTTVSGTVTQQAADPENQGFSGDNHMDISFSSSLHSTVPQDFEGFQDRGRSKHRSSSKSKKKKRRRRHSSSSSSSPSPSSRGRKRRHSPHTDFPTEALSRLVTLLSQSADRLATPSQPAQDQPSTSITQPSSDPLLLPEHRPDSPSEVESVATGDFQFHVTRSHSRSRSRSHSMDASEDSDDEPIMGTSFSKESFEKAVEVVRRQLGFDSPPVPDPPVAKRSKLSLNKPAGPRKPVMPSSDISVFEVNIRYIGGLISMYALTKDEMFKNKAVEIAEKLMPAFNTPTGIPYGLINARTGAGRNWGWASGGCSILSEFGSLHLEFSYLSEITGDSKYRDKVQKVREILKNIDKVDGLYPNYLHPKTGKWGQKHVSLGALGDSYYEYLLKSFIVTGERDTEALEMYKSAIEAMEKKMKQTSSSGYVFFGDFRGAKVEKKMDHLSCFSGGMFALGSKYMDNPEHHLELGAKVTETCHKSYDNSATKLGPEAFRFEGHGEAVAMRQNEKYYILRPETIESYFVMWRLTKDQKYRDWGWEAIQAIEKNCRVDSGYSGVKDVYASRVVHDDVQQSFFLAETLKYLYLLYSDDDFISLDEWVFNTEAHPLPIKKDT
ncbi:Mannosyl-oligosaccharide 1,2-alpha-mannosidase IB [Holothuria leucospilota]|uniref:alpha-1,2-Mannosidase n=1 Tax=Holothuria leucospilota TaxID=206669 RepID=A0A9Q1BJ10_HOLLE|nr:Mannosyl-oligosaccharide 1,2-alpha-mannosidase IB [Holothuria leucospilota]